MKLPPSIHDAPTEPLTGPTRHKGRGAASNPAGRFESIRHVREDDGWAPEELLEPPARPKTQVTLETARSIISRNDSPDLGFDQSINPYRGCEHGCVYCYARPSHGYLNLSAGLDFETKLFAKANAADLLRAELGKRGYVCSPINLGANTDPYQPIERRHAITRSVLEVLSETQHPTTIVTKNALVERDIDLLADMAKRRLVHVFVSVTTLDNRLSATLEPRATAPHRRLQTVETLSAAGVPCGVMVAPVIPFVTDQFMESILEHAAAAGARVAGYSVLRLPHEVKDLMRQWLALHLPERAAHVMNVIRDMRGGRDNDPDFGSRMRGQGAYADLLRQRFAVACRKFGLNRGREALDLDTTRFMPPRPSSPQGELF
ncbi:PA0069 family radical SAM protein [Xanthomonadaceae bacterium JHOS43]|nr:PA0069 family radical SAM protein [Xanthomonadaceae bacterium JHOS43]